MDLHVNDATYRLNREFSDTSLVDRRWRNIQVASVTLPRHQTGTNWGGQPDDNLIIILREETDAGSRSHELHMHVTHGTTRVGRLHCNGQNILSVPIGAKKASLGDIIYQLKQMPNFMQLTLILEQISWANNNRTNGNISELTSANLQMHNRTNPHGIKGSGSSQKGVLQDW